MAESVIAITVTFNSTNNLKKAINALLNQTYTLKRIIIVDNNSSKEEKAILKEMVKEHNIIEVLWLKENTGGAGGFYHGMKYVRDNYAPDWYWLMDDDAFPENLCLEKLMDKKEYMPGIGCLAPLIYGIDLKEFQLYHHKKENTLLTKDMPVTDDVNKLKDVEELEADAFVGPLFSKAAIERVGIADGDLFIYGDDLEYTYRVSRFFKILLIKDAIINHKDPLRTNQALNPKWWWKEYYEMRNRIMFIKKYQKNFAKRILAILYMILNAISKMLKTALKREYRGFRMIRIKLIFKAIKDGICRKKGKRIDPVHYNTMIDRLINR